MEGLKPYRGVIVPIVTSLNDDFSIDTESHNVIIEKIVRSGAVPFVLGTTGEHASLSSGQKEVLVEATVNQVSKRCPVFAGISANCLEESIAKAEKFTELGVDLLVAHVPCYFPMDAEQSVIYFLKLADHCPKPLLIYNIPQTTHFSIPVESVEKLSHHPNIAGIKDSEPNKERMEHSLTFWKDRSDFSYFMGCSVLSVLSLKSGADGIVPSTGNIFPDWYCEMVEAIDNGDFHKADILQQLTDQVTLIFQKGRTLNYSIPALKVLMSELGLCKPWVMPPMCPMGKEEEEKFREQARDQLKTIVDSKMLI